MSATDFASLKLPAAQLKNLNDLGYSQMTPIQAQALPFVLAGQDLIAKAKTGSGKTAAFGIGLLETLNPRLFAVQGLVLCPTRELATQVAQELRKLARYRQNIKVTTLCGGQPIGPQIGSLAHGAHIVVGTPGRVRDHLRKGTLTLEKAQVLVLDEADRMLEMGFNDDLSFIADQIAQPRQTLLFSATYPQAIEALSARYQREPVMVEVESLHSTTQIEQLFYEQDRDTKADFLLRLLSQHRPESAVVFCNTKQTCDDVAAHLRQAGHSAQALHGDMEQQERDLILTLFANGSRRVLVASDVAARGLDIDDLAAVVNYELPRDPEVYVHRIGRTGRAGKGGLAISLVSPKESHAMMRIEDYQGRELAISEAYLVPTELRMPKKPDMVTLQIGAGRKQKLRPGDIVGALTRTKEVSGDQLGKIRVMDFSTFVAVERAVARQALDILQKDPIKGRKFRARKV